LKMVESTLSADEQL